MRNDLMNSIITSALEHISENFDILEENLSSDKEMDLIGLSSLDIISLIIHLEELYNVQIPSDLSGSIKTVKDIAVIISDLIEKTEKRNKQITEVQNKIFETGDI